MENINFPNVGVYPTKEVRKIFLKCMQDLKLNIRYIRLINIRECITGLRFYIKTRNFMAVAEYDYLTDIVISFKCKKHLKKDFISACKVVFIDNFISDKNWFIRRK